jgi:hypothetical protein
LKTGAKLPRFHSHAAGTASSLGLRAYLTVHGEARRISAHFHDRDRQSNRVQRGLVKRFTKQSRKRMLDKIHTIRRGAALPQFLTLTFPDMFPGQKDAKRMLDNLFKRWKRHSAHVSAIWKMEVIDRKSGASAGQVAPHFHLLVWGKLDFDRARSDWHEVTGSTDYAHLQHGVDAQDLESWRGAVFYCAKYCAKIDGTFQTEGRCWGVHNRAALPIDREPKTIPCTVGQAQRFCRTLRRFVRSRTGKKRWSRVLYTLNPREWVRLLETMRT